MKSLEDHRIVSHEEWTEERKALLAKEKEFTRLRDELSEERRNLPWERVTKGYVFQGPHGTQTLEQLFEGRSQLVIYHAMFDPETVTPRTPYTKDAPCSMCSFWMDNLERMVIHVAHRDVTLMAVSRAPVEKLEAYRRRMGWTFKWMSVGNGDFNRDYGVTLTAEEIAGGQGSYNYARTAIPLAELPGISVFYKDEAGRVFHTYSTYARGLDMLNLGYHYLDIVPKGRDEGERGQGKWVRRRDEYEDAKAASCH